jgi:hypothetical protein
MVMKGINGLHVSKQSDFSIGCSKINNDGLEVMMVWVFGQLVTWIMAREWDMMS